MQTITTGTIVRTICLLVALLNQIMTVMGKSPLSIEDETISLLVTTGITVATSVVAWWKNNSFTTTAIEADTKRQEQKIQDYEEQRLTESIPELQPMEAEIQDDEE